MRGRHRKLDAVGEKRGSLGNGLVKTPALQEQTAKIEQKLGYLKQKILQKKKLSVQEKRPAIDEGLSAFLGRIGLGEYAGVLAENGIDSYEVLREIKQAELEEIGVLKGHALKMVVHLRREDERRQKEASKREESKGREESKAREETKPTLSESSIREKPVPCSVDSMQTESIPLQTVKKSFCLYCFTRSSGNFCCVNCEALYNGMFSKYEGNLQRAQESFMPEPPPEEELSDNQEFLENFDFLFKPQQQPDFDLQEYEDIKSILRK